MENAGLTIVPSDSLVVNSWLSFYTECTKNCLKGLWLENLSIRAFKSALTKTKFCVTDPIGADFYNHISTHIVTIGKEDIKGNVFSFMY